MKPFHLMRHRANHYAQGTTKSGGADVINYPTASTVPTTPNIRCFMQAATSQIVDFYKARELRIKSSCFLVDTAVFDSVTEQDWIGFDGELFRIVAKVDLGYMGQVYRLDLAEDLYK